LLRVKFRRLLRHLEGDQKLSKFGAITETKIAKFHAQKPLKSSWCYYKNKFNEKARIRLFEQI